MKTTSLLPVHRAARASGSSRCLSIASVLQALETDGADAVVDSRAGRLRLRLVLRAGRIAWSSSTYTSGAVAAMIGAPQADWTVRRLQPSGAAGSRGVQAMLLEASRLMDERALVAAVRP